MIKPTRKNGGAAFNGNYLMATRPYSGIPGNSMTRYASLTEWCSKNFISKDQGKTLIKKKLLIGQRLHGQWWVCANLHCMNELLEYLGMSELFFDAENSIES